MDEIAYEQFQRLEHTHWWLRGRRTVFFHLLDRMLPERRPLTSLDVGCGYGAMLPDLERYGPAHGVDMFPGAVEHCRDAGHEHVRVASAYELPDASASFDLVSFFDCLEHLDDDVAALRESARVLRPGGHIVVTVPAYNFLYADNDRLAHHKRRYTARELRAKLRAAGFEQRKLTYVNALLFPLILPLVLVKKVRERMSRGDGPATTNLTHSVPRPLNEALFRVFAAERVLLERVSFPAGHSIFALAVKRDA